MYYEIYFNGSKWVAYNPYEDLEDNSVICTDLDRDACIEKAEEMGYRWDGE